MAITATTALRCFVSLTEIKSLLEQSVKVLYKLQNFQMRCVLGRGLGVVGAVLLWCVYAQAALLSDYDAQSLQREFASVQKIGVYIGTFDPLHVDHEGLIEAVLRERKVDLVIVGANDNIPHKPNANPWRVRNSFLEDTFRHRPEVLVANKQGFAFPMVASNVGWVRGVLQQASFRAIIGNDIATLPHLPVDLPKIIKENGGRIDGWIVNNSRPELNRSEVIPTHIDGKRVEIIETGGSVSSTFIRESISALGARGVSQQSGIINEHVARIIDALNLYGALSPNNATALPPESRSELEALDQLVPPRTITASKRRCVGFLAKAR